MLRNLLISICFLSNSCLLAQKVDCLDNFRYAIEHSRELFEGKQYAFQMQYEITNTQFKETGEGTEQHRNTVYLEKKGDWFYSRSHATEAFRDTNTYIILNHSKKMVFLLKNPQKELSSVFSERDKTKHHQRLLENLSDYRCQNLVEGQQQLLLQLDSSFKAQTNIRSVQLQLERDDQNRSWNILYQKTDYASGDFIRTEWKLIDLKVQSIKAVNPTKPIWTTAFVDKSMNALKEKYKHYELKDLREVNHPYSQTNP